MFQKFCVLLKKKFRVLGFKVGTEKKLMQTVFEGGDPVELNFDSLLEEASASSSSDIIFNDDPNLNLQSLVSWKNHLPCDGMYGLITFKVEQGGFKFISMPFLEKFRLYLIPNMHHLMIYETDAVYGNVEKISLFNIEYSVISLDGAIGGDCIPRCITHWMTDHFYGWLKIHFIDGFISKLEFFPYERKPGIFIRENIFKMELDLKEMSLRKIQYDNFMCVKELLLFRAQNYSIHDLFWVWKEDCNKSSNQVMQIVKQIHMENENLYKGFDFKIKSCIVEKFTWESKRYYPSSKDMSKDFFWVLC